MPPSVGAGKADETDRLVVKTVVFEPQDTTPPEPVTVRTAGSHSVPAETDLTSTTAGHSSHAGTLRTTSQLSTGTPRQTVVSLYRCCDERLQTFF